jgi:hypothetical protein
LRAITKPQEKNLENRPKYEQNKAGKAGYFKSVIFGYQASINLAAVSILNVVY